MTVYNHVTNLCYLWLIMIFFLWLTVTKLVFRMIVCDQVNINCDGMMSKSQSITINNELVITNHSKHICGHRESLQKLICTHSPSQKHYTNHHHRNHFKCPKTLSRTLIIYLRITLSAKDHLKFLFKFQTEKRAANSFLSNCITSIDKQREQHCKFLHHPWNTDSAVLPEGNSLGGSMHRN